MTALWVFKRLLERNTMNEKQNERIANMTFSSVFPHYLDKIEKKGRSVEELYQVIEWLTGFNLKEINQAISDELTFKEFFVSATLNQKSDLIRGSICGYKIEELENPLTRKVRMLDKLVDELAKGKKLDKIFRE